MIGVNRAIKYKKNNSEYRINESIASEEIPCVFICYQRKDEAFANVVSNYIISKQLDVYFDLEDNDLKQINQSLNPSEVTNSIKKGLNKSDYMIVIVSPNTYKSPWVPFEVGFAYDEKGDKMKILRHKEIAENSIPAYLEVKEVLNGTASLNHFLWSIRRDYLIYEKLERMSHMKSFSEYNSNPLNKYLVNE